MIYISLLRGINVSGKNILKMDKLKELYESLDFKEVTTYIQSGNVIFVFKKFDLNILSDKIKHKINKIYGYDVSVIIRTMNNFEKIINNNPFLKDNYEEISKLHVTLLRDYNKDVNIDNLKTKKSGNDKFYIIDKEIYLLCPDGYGKTKYNNTFFERKLNTEATTRNWKTINKIYDIINLKYNN